MGSDESHFNVSVGRDGQNHRTVSTNHNLFEEKGVPKRYRTEVLPLTNLGLPLGQTGSRSTTTADFGFIVLYLDEEKRVLGGSEFQIPGATYQALGP